jgi:hypothetical protein
VTAARPARSSRSTPCPAKTCSNLVVQKNHPAEPDLPTVLRPGQDRHLHRLLPGQSPPSSCSRPTPAAATLARRDRGLDLHAERPRPTRLQSQRRARLADRRPRLRAARRPQQHVRQPAVYTSEPFVLLSYHLAHRRPPGDARLQGPARTRPATATPTTSSSTTPSPPARFFRARCRCRLLPLPGRRQRQREKRRSPGTPDSAHARPATTLLPSFEDRKGSTGTAARKARVNSIGSTSAPVVTLAGVGSGGPHRRAHASRSPSPAVAAPAPRRRQRRPRSACSFTTRCARASSSPEWPPSPPSAPILPYLRPLTPAPRPAIPSPARSLTIVYRPVWPSNAPELRVAETLTLPKFGLPASQPGPAPRCSTSSPSPRTAKPSVTLHDPVREKTPSRSASRQTRFAADIRTHRAGQDLLPGPPAAPPDALLLRSQPRHQGRPRPPRQVRR